MNGLMKKRLSPPISFTKKREWIRLEQDRENWMSHTDAHCAVDIPRAAPAIGEGQSCKESDRWCALVSDAILFAYGISVPEEHLWNAAVTGTLEKAAVEDAVRWAQAVVRWKTDQADEVVWPGHIAPELWPLFWEVALRVDRERTLTAIGYALTALAYREYDGLKDQRACSGTPTNRRIT